MVSISLAVSPKTLIVRMDNWVEMGSFWIENWVEIVYEELVI